MDINQFLEIEKKYNLNSLQYDGIRYWTYARFNIWNYDICSEKLELQEAHNKQKMTIKKFKDLLLAYINGCRIKQHYDVLVLNHQRRVFNGQTFECVYTDDVIDGKYNALFLEAPFQYSHLKPVKSKNIAYTDKIIIDSELYVKMYKIFHKKEYNIAFKSIKNDISDAVKEMQSVFGWSKSVDNIANKLTENVIRCSFERKRYEKILEKVSPKLIVEVVHYGRMPMLINELAKSRNIPTIEFQHGTMYREHAAYQYNLDQNIPQLPDYLFAFSEFWKNNISVPIPDNNIVVTGFPNFEKKMLKYKGYERSDDRKTLLFLSQGTIGKYLSKLACEVANKLSNEQFRIIYKLHPSEYSTWREELPDLINSGIEVIDSRNVDLYELFAQSDIQIGAYSTAVFEGMGFGVSTYIYNVGHYDIMLPLIEQGYAKLISSAEELVSSISQDENETVDGSLFWKMNAKENIQNEIDRLLKIKD